MSGRMGWMRTFSSVTFAVVVAVALTACGINDPSENTNTDFTATLQPGGGNVHECEAKDSGEFTVKLTALAPNSNLGLSFYVGKTVDGLCTRILGQEGVLALSQVYALSQPIQKGRYCLQ